MPSQPTAPPVKPCLFCTVAGRRCHLLAAADAAAAAIAAARLTNVAKPAIAEAPAVRHAYEVA